MEDGKIKNIYSKNDNPNKYIFKRKDSKETKVIMLIKDYFKNNRVLTKDKFDEFLQFIDLKTIWKTKQEQNILWNSIISYSKNKNSINYESTLKGIMELFKSDEDDKKNNNFKADHPMKKNIDEMFGKYFKSICFNGY